LRLFVVTFGFTVAGYVLHVVVTLRCSLFVVRCSFSSLIRYVVPVAPRCRFAVAVWFGFCRLFGSAVGYRVGLVTLRLPRAVRYGSVHLI